MMILPTTTTRDGRLDLLIGDTPILDYYRANDPGCTLRTVDVIEEDNYAVGMTKGLRLQVQNLEHLAHFFFFPLLPSSSLFFFDCLSEPKRIDPASIVG